MKQQKRIFISSLICILAVPLAQNAVALPLSGFGSPSDHADLAGGSVIDFETNANGAFATTFDFADVSMSGNNLLRIISSFSGSYNVTGNSLALTTNDRTQEITFNFAAPVDAFGFNFGGADLDWHLIAYSATSTVLDAFNIAPFGSSNNGEWFGIAAPGIASAKLYNTAFDITGNTGTLDYVVIDNFTYAEPIPEPATILLVGTGLAGLAAARRRKNR
jgi:hypothetical protein